MAESLTDRAALAADLERARSDFRHLLAVADDDWNRPTQALAGPTNSCCSTWCSATWSCGGSCFSCAYSGGCPTGSAVALRACSTLPLDRFTQSTTTDPARQHWFTTEAEWARRWTAKSASYGGRSPARMTARSAAECITHRLGPPLFPGGLHDARGRLWLSGPALRSPSEAANTQPNVSLTPRLPRETRCQSRVWSELVMAFCCRVDTGLVGASKMSRPLS